MKNKLILSLAFLFIYSCSSFKAERVSNTKSDELSLKITDEWVAEDTTLIVNEVMKQLNGHRGYRNYILRSQGEPVRLFIGEVKNLTSEAYFPISDLNDELLYKLSGHGDFILVDAASREKILKEITYQQDGMVDPQTIQNIGKQTGANAMIFGNVYMQPKRRKGKTIKEYAVNLRITDIEKAIEIARFRAKVNKYSEQSGSGI